MLFRIIGIIGGAAILFAAAHVTIEHTGGYGTADSVLTMAIAGGVALGALFIGSAISDGRYAVAIWIMVALLCGEAFGLLRTAERLVEAREQAQAPLREKSDARAKAKQRVDRAEKALGAFSATSPRLTAALESKATADRAVVEQASLRGCRKNCRALLQAQVDEAAKEVTAARSALAVQRKGLQAELNDARTSLEQLPVSRSSTPLADRLQIQPWILDIIMAVFGSLGANGLGAALLAYGAHSPKRSYKAAVESEAVVTPARPVEAAEIIENPAPRTKTAKRQPATIGNDHDHIAAFAHARFEPSDSDVATFEDMMAAYRAWCGETETSPLASDRVGVLLAELVSHVGLNVEDRDGDPVVVGLKVRPTTLKLIEAA